ncbi:MAG: UvrD-helicase domain-containing protein [Anaerolineales bacterium]|nr:UvrD-helicase domain-containing protein [Anaerolineales bacterium]
MDTEKANSTFDLTDEQKLAVGTRGRDILITAGPGSGKTLTLVERYVKLLGQGLSPRNVAAITFTEKAAREMRNRVRRRVSDHAKEGGKKEEKLHWQGVEAKLDAARIGTIHSLCAEILRTHPAEANLDPDFEVIEEGLSAALKTQAIDDALIWATGHPENALVFQSFSPNYLKRVLRFLLDRRLDASALLSRADFTTLGESAILNELIELHGKVELVDALAELKRMKVEGRLLQDAGDKLASQIDTLLDEWVKFNEGVHAEDILEASSALYSLRRKGLQLRVGKKTSVAKGLIRGMQLFYDEHINPWIGGAQKGDLPPDEYVEENFTKNLPRLKGIFTQARKLYNSALESRYAMDFDDLESGALELLKRAEIQKHWRSSLNAILVDEFQDTNERQQEIVNQLRGEPGRLFVVGDARQSIYRFRGAKVTVFREMQKQIEAEGGESIELDITFRAHPRLLNALEDLCSQFLGTEDGPLYRVPFTPLRPDRERARVGMMPPFVEVICGLGGSAKDARPVAAQALARRLIELQAEGQITEWDDVALLFRASSGFQYYEDAFETLGIPFVTVAGGGFFDRPEIRDVLNMLRALADPLDDLAMAGLLRSPAFGLRDETLYLLRWRGESRMHLWPSLNEDLSNLDQDDQRRVMRARMILESLVPLADRLPIAELLNELIIRTDYRAILASAGSRMWRNLDKLLQDAHKSGLVRVRSFLDYVQTLRDVGAREGEAPVEEHGSVRLMTVHKAKGLEFNIVVLADAARMPRKGGQIAYLLPETGIAARADRLEANSMVTRLAHYINAQESEAEEDRLLYVALTRTREKLLVSGHVTERQSGPRTDGWLKKIFEVVGISAADMIEKPEEWKSVSLPSGENVGIKFNSQEDSENPVTELEIQWPESEEISLHRPLTSELVREIDPDEQADPMREWRATGAQVHAPAAAIGNMVHAAIHRGLIPVGPEASEFLETLALREGLVERGQRSRAVNESIKLLERLARDSRWDEIDKATERYHELPFSRPLPSTDSPIGTIDLLYKTDRGWHLIDFKTDELRDDEDLEQATEEHRGQLTRYQRALNDLLKIEAVAYICFLDYQGMVEWIGIE